MNRDLLQGLHLLAAQPDLGWATLGLCSPSVNGPHPAMPGQPHPQHGPAPLPPKSVLLHMGREGGSDRDYQAP